MKTKVLLFLALILAGSLCRVDAQIVNSIVKSKTNVAKNRVIYDANKHVDNKINDAVDKEFDKLVNKKKDGDSTATEESKTTTSSSSGSKSKSSSGNSAMQKAMMGKLGMKMERPANMKDVYEYTGNIKMDLQTWNEDGEAQDPVAYTTQFNDKSSGIAMEFRDKEKGYSTMIFDYDGLLMLVLTDNGTDKSGIATPLGGYQTTPDTVKTDNSTANTQPTDYYSTMKKTGKTKTIAGYKCDEYFDEDEESTINLWIANDVPADLWAKVGTTSAFSSVYTGRTNGFVMESDHRSKTDKSRSHMIVTEVNKNQTAKINTVGYSIMTMNMPAGEEDKK